MNETSARSFEIDADLEPPLDIDGDEDVASPLGGLIELRPERRDVNLRLDKYVAEQIPERSRAFVQRLIEDGLVRVDGLARARTFKVTPGQVVTVDLPPPRAVAVEPEAIPLSIVYEDDDVVVIDKAAGMVVHPAPGHATGTLVNALLAHAPGIAVGGTLRPGIVHRIDKETSGLIVAAKSDRGRQTLLDQWRLMAVEKRYIALVRGVVEENEATIDAPIGRDPNERRRMTVIASGRPAVSHFRVEERFEEATLLDVEIETGRTHQIRVHLAFAGHPVVGDPVYNPATGRFGGRGAIVGRQFLHAAGLAFSLPDGRPCVCEAPLPDDLVAALESLRGERQA